MPRAKLTVKQMRVICDAFRHEMKAAIEKCDEDETEALQAHNKGIVKFVNELPFSPTATNALMFAMMAGILEGMLAGVERQDV